EVLLSLYLNLHPEKEAVKPKETQINLYFPERDIVEKYSHHPQPSFPNPPPAPNPSSTRRRATRITRIFNRTSIPLLSKIRTYETPRRKSEAPAYETLQMHKIAKPSQLALFSSDISWRK